MPINLKQFNDGKTKDLSFSKKILDFLKIKKQAFTVKELAMIFFNNKKSVYRFTTPMNRLEAKGLIIHKSPYYAYNFDKNVEIKHKF